MERKIKYLLIISGVVLLVALLTFNINQVSSSTQVLFPILDVAGRPLKNPIGTPECDLQMEKANEICKKGGC